MSNYRLQSHNPRLIMKPLHHCAVCTHVHKWSDSFNFWEWVKQYGYDLIFLFWTHKSFSKTTSYNIISMIILNDYETIMSLHIHRQSQCNPERFRSFCRQISQSRQNSRKCKLHKKSLIEKIDIYINNVYVPHHRHHNRRDRWLIVSPKDTGNVG